MSLTKVREYEVHLLILGHILSPSAAINILTRCALIMMHLFPTATPPVFAQCCGEHNLSPFFPQTVVDSL